jgi:hypothetical protein
VLARSAYTGKSSHKIILPLLAERGEGRGEESNPNERGLTLINFQRTLAALEKQNDDYYLINNFA